MIDNAKTIKYGTKIFLNFYDALKSVIGKDKKPQAIKNRGIWKIKISVPIYLFGNTQCPKIIRTIANPFDIS